MSRAKKLADNFRNVFKLKDGLTKDDLDMLIKSLGGKLIYTNNFSESEAYVKKNGEESFLISVKEIYPLRTIFSIAHELGHLFLHMGYILDEEKWHSLNDEQCYNRSLESNWTEYEANDFAANLLMPEKQFKNKLIQLKNLDLVASYFNVSGEAAYNRCKFLKISLGE